MFTRSEMLAEGFNVCSYETTAWFSFVIIKSHFPEIFIFVYMIFLKFTKMFRIKVKNFKNVWMSVLCKSSNIFKNVDRFTFSCQLELF